jgi:hypothetical protein
MRLLAPLYLLMVGCGSTDSEPSYTPDASSSAGDAQHPPGDADPTDAPPSDDSGIDPPPPTFRAAGSYFSAGKLAIDETGLRSTYTLNGVQLPSYIRFKLVSPDVPSCHVNVLPTFVQFGQVTTSAGRVYKTLVLDAATATIITNECNTADANVRPALTTMGLIEVGFLRAADVIFAAPRLDMVSVRTPWIPSYATMSLDPARGLAYPMANDGTLDTNLRVEPDPGTLPAALYEFSPS